jgi:5-methylcytosine-specific restriction endonuclease McrA
LAKIAAIKITTNSSKVYVSSGKFRRTYLLREWADCVSRSNVQLIPLKDNDVAQSQQIYLFRGIGFRIKIGESTMDCEHLIQFNSTILIQQKELKRQNPQITWTSSSPMYTPVVQQPIMPVQQAAPIQGTIYNSQTKNKFFEHIRQHTNQSEGDTSSILARVTRETHLTAERFIQRNILNEKISRNIRQDVKIAVAIRDQGQCTHLNEFRQRCQMQHELQYDHRFIPFAYGGPQSTWNLTLYCKPHNNAKGANVDFIKGAIEFLWGSFNQ